MTRKGWIGWALYELELYFGAGCIPERSITKVRAPSESEAIRHARDTVRVACRGLGGRLDGKAIAIRVVSVSRVRPGLQAGGDR
jgi:hypothetical protein